LDRCVEIAANGTTVWAEAFYAEPSLEGREVGFQVGHDRVC
jgi:hypothetical protein